MERRSLNRPLARVGTGQPAHVSIEGNVFRLIDDAGEESKPLPELNCIILDINEKMSRIYYGTAYQKGNPGRPLCFSDNGIAPSDRADEPQAPSCTPDKDGKTGCRWAVWGSDTSALTGKGIPACRTYAKIAIMVVAGKDKDWVPAIRSKPGAVFFFAVPPASHRALSEYGRKCAGMGKFDIPWTGEEVQSDVSYLVTRIKFDGFGKVSFESVGFINEQIDGVINEIDQARVDSAIGRDDVPITGLPAPANGGTVQPIKGETVEPPALPQPKAPVAAAPRKPGRPRKNGNAPAASPAPAFEPKPNDRFVTGQEVRDHAAQQQQEAKEAAQSESPEPSEDVLDQFMNLDLK